MPPFANLPPIAGAVQITKVKTMEADKLRKLMKVLLDHHSDNPDLRLLAMLRASGISVADLQQFAWMPQSSPVSREVIERAIHVARSHEEAGFVPRHSLTPAMIAQTIEAAMRDYSPGSYPAPAEPATSDQASQ